MTHRFLSTLLIAIGILFLSPANSLLYAQSGSACLFTFEPEYLGEGNCFRVILRNDDPNSSPYSLEYSVVNGDAIVAGQVQPSKSFSEWDPAIWHFRDYRPLGVGIPDTGYICFVAVVPSFQVALAWRDKAENVLCRDTLQMNVFSPNSDCVKASRFDMYCALPIIQTDISNNNQSASKPRQNDRPIWLQLDMAFTNQSGSGIGATDITGPECGGGRATLHDGPIKPPFPSGSKFGLSLDPSSLFCFSVDEDLGWKIENMEFIYYDSSGSSVLCKDTVFFMINGFACIPGSVAESSSDRTSSTNLRITGLESGEGKISFVLQGRENVSLWLVDMNGNQVVRLIEDQSLEAAKHEVILRTEGIPSGTYICLIRAGEKSEGRVVQIVR